MQGYYDLGDEVRYSKAKLNVFLRNRVLPGWLFRLRASLQKVPDADLYNPTFQPWRAKDFRALYEAVSGRTLVSREAAWTMLALARQALSVDGDFIEAGVYRGGTAKLLQGVLASDSGRRALHLFDTFEGMPNIDSARDLHSAKDFSDTSVEAVSAFVGRQDWVRNHKGPIPDTFAGLEGLRFAFAHIDVDLHKSVLDCSEFIYPRLNSGGIMIFDDYGAPSCPGARSAVDSFFAGRPEVPLVIRTGQAIIYRR